MHQAPSSATEYSTSPSGRAHSDLRILFVCLRRLVVLHAISAKSRHLRKIPPRIDLRTPIFCGETVFFG